MGGCSTLRNIDGSAHANSVSGLSLPQQAFIRTMPSSMPRCYLPLQLRGGAVRYLCRLTILCLKGSPQEQHRCQALPVQLPGALVSVLQVHRTYKFRGPKQPESPTCPTKMCASPGFFFDPLPPKSNGAGRPWSPPSETTTLIV